MGTLKDNLVQKYREQMDRFEISILNADFDDIISFEDETSIMLRCTIISGNDVICRESDLLNKHSVDWTPNPSGYYDIFIKSGHEETLIEGLLKVGGFIES